MEGPYIGAFTDIDKGATEAMWHIDNKAEEVGWDAPPVLLLIKVKPLAELGGTGAVLSSLDISLFTGWNAVMERYESPKDMLAFLTFVVTKFPKEMKGPLFDLDHLYGIAFVSEIWTVHTNTKDKAAMKKLRKKIESEDQEISKMAERVESRMVFMVSMEGRAVALMHERDGVPLMLEPEDGKKIAGAIPELMHKLVAAIKS
jgi:hypothetical protein